MQNRHYKIIAISLTILLLISIMPVKSFAYGNVDYQNFSEYKSKYRILYGLILLGLGGALAYDGFRNVEIDISKPELKFNAQSRWHTSSINSGFRDLESIGTITNTGNVALRQITFEVRYRSLSPNRYYPSEGYNNTPIGEPVRFNNTSSILYVSEIGQTDSWEHHNTWNYMEADNNPLGELEDKWYPETYPHHEIVEILNIRYSYDKKYKKVMNSVYEGIAGVLLAGAGIYLLVDYIIGLKKFDYYMKNHDLNFYVQNDYEEFQFMLSKRI
jgi:putative Mn2+ efflux pump MntP